MKKNVSFSLLGLILLLAAGIAASSVYYQYTYSDLQTKYEVSNETLHATMDDYQEKEQILDATLQNLSLSEKREDVLGGKYEEVETEKEGLQTDLTKANAELVSLHKKHDALQRDYDSLDRKYGTLELEKRVLEGEVSDLERDVKKLRNQIIGLNVTPVV
ncbi:MAG: hypothetical protein U9N46_07860 [Euryarchaeota archaeon]|nr:hypothetical protein [Euryarchaeota archaeon]